MFFNKTFQNVSDMLVWEDIIDLTGGIKQIKYLRIFFAGI